MNRLRKQLNKHNQEHILTTLKEFFCKEKLHKKAFLHRSKRITIKEIYKNGAKSLITNLKL